MHGGYRLRLYGVCFDDSYYTIHIGRRQIRDCQFSTVFLTCTMPMIPEGRHQIEVKTSNGRLVAHTDFLSFMPESNADSILSNYGELDHMAYTKGDRRFSLHFQNNLLTRNYLFQIVVYDYSTEYQVVDDIFHNIDTKRVDLGLGVRNLSLLNNLTINFQSIFPLTGESPDQIHLVDISFELVAPDTISQTTSWKGTHQFIVRTFIVSNELTASFCALWSGVQLSANTPHLVSQAPTCPCRVRTTWDEEQLGFTMDHSCNGRKNASWSCRFQRGARGCYRRKSLTSDIGAHCCYDNNGVLITNWRAGSGSIKAHYPNPMKTLSTFRHFVSDILPFYSCCGTGTEQISTCEHYVKHRPVCNNCDQICNPPPPRPSGGGRDPHFSTLDGNSYTFNGHGEYALVKSSDGQFEIQVRLARLDQDSVLSMDHATAIVAFVIHHEDQSRVQFELFPKLRMIELRIDERLVEFTPLSDPDELASSSLIYSDDRQLIIRQTDIHSYSISYGESGIQFLVYVRPQLDFLDLVSILSSTFKSDQQFQGLLGGFQGLIYPDGTSVSASLNDDQLLFPYGESWRTTRDSSIFHYRAQDSHAQHQDLTYRPIFQQDLLNKYGNTSRYEMAKKACKQIAHEQQCIFDVLITNDPTISQQHEKYETTLQSVEEYIELVTNDIEIRKNSTTITSIITSTHSITNTPIITNNPIITDSPIVTNSPIITNTPGPTSSTNGNGTPKPETSAANYLACGMWHIVLFTSIIVGYSC